MSTMVHESCLTLQRWTLKVLIKLRVKHSIHVGEYTACKMMLCACIFYFETPQQRTTAFQFLAVHRADNPLAAAAKT